MSITPNDIVIALGRTTEPSEIESAQWAMWIADARMLIEARLGDLAALDQAKLDYVVRQAVVAHVQHPDDATQVDVAVDDARYSRRYTTGKGRVRILDEWWDLLAPATASGAFVIDTVGYGCSHLPWCALNFLAAYCSCGVDIAGYPIFELADEA